MRTRPGLSMNDAVKHCSRYSTFFCHDGFLPISNSGGDSVVVKLLAQIVPLGFTEIPHNSPVNGQGATTTHDSNNMRG
jgi:hypothetical protein